MKSRLTIEGVVLTALLAVFACRAVIATTVIPPWQGPDEPGHFALAYGLSMPPGTQTQVEGDVLQSMVRHRWWELYDDPPPDNLRSFEYVAGIGPGTLAQPLYYGLAASVLTFSRPSDLEAAYVHLRFLSIGLAVLAIALGWAGSRLLFGPEIAAGAAAVAGLHPQFLLAAISVNADALLNVWGAFVWWQAARVVTERQRDFSAVLMFVGAGAALLTKRLGLVLVGVALAVAAASLLSNRRLRFTRRDAVMITVAAGGAVAVLSVAAVFFEGQVATWWVYWTDALVPRRPVDNTTLWEALRFARMTVDYSWLIGGWLRFQPPNTWLWIARVLIIGGFAGAAIVLIKSRHDRTPLALAWWFVLAQVAAMLVVVFWTVPSAPQARYLFPVFAPITVLLYVGLRGALPRHLCAYFPAVLVALLAIMDVTGFTTVHIPAYVP